MATEEGKLMPLVCSAPLALPEMGTAPATSVVRLAALRPLSGMSIMRVESTTWFNVEVEVSTGLPSAETVTEVRDSPTSSSALRVRLWFACKMTPFWTKL